MGVGSSPAAELGMNSRTFYLIVAIPLLNSRGVSVLSIKVREFCPLWKSRVMSSCVMTKKNGRRASIAIADPQHLRSHLNRRGR